MTHTPLQLQLCPSKGHRPAKSVQSFLVKTSMQSSQAGKKTLQLYLDPKISDMNSYVPEQNTNLAMMFGTCYSLHINLLGKPDSNWNNFSWIKAQTNSLMPLTSKHARGSGNISEMLLQGHDHLLNIKAQTSPLYSDLDIYPS